jgi:TIR domain-containing protein
MSMRIFISFSSQDSTFVQNELIPFLRTHGFSTWWSTDDIRTSEDWERKILAGLYLCEWFIVLVSPTSVQSESVRAEFRWAIEGRQGHFIPLLLRDCRLYDLHLKLPGIQHIDFRNNTDNAFVKLKSFLDDLGTWPPKADQNSGFNAAHAAIPAGSSRSLCI